MTKSGKPTIDEALARRISDALSSDEGLGADAALMEQLSADPAASRYARDVGRLDKWLASWPAATPSDAEFEAMAQRIEQGLKQLPTGLMQPFLSPPAFDDEDARRDAQGQLPAKAGPFKTAFPKPGALGAAPKPSVAAGRSKAGAPIGSPPLSPAVPAPAAGAVASAEVVGGAAGAASVPAPEPPPGARIEAASSEQAADAPAPAAPSSSSAAEADALRASAAPSGAAPLVAEPSGAAPSGAAPSGAAPSGAAPEVPGPEAPGRAANEPATEASSAIDDPGAEAPKGGAAPTAAPPTATSALDSVPAPAIGAEVDVHVDAGEPPLQLDPGRSTISLVPEALSLVPEAPVVVSRPPPPKEARKPAASKTPSDAPAASRWTAAKSPIDDRFSIPVPAPRAPVFSLDPIQNIPPAEPEKRSRAAWPMWAAAAAVGLAVAAGGTLLLTRAPEGAAPRVAAAGPAEPTASATATVAPASAPAPARALEEAAALPSAAPTPAASAPASPEPTAGLLPAPNAPALDGVLSAAGEGMAGGARAEVASSADLEARRVGIAARRRPAASGAPSEPAASEDSASTRSTGAPRAGAPSRGAATGGAAGGGVAVPSPSAASSRAPESDAELPETPDRGAVRDALEGVAPQVQACFGDEHGVVDVVVMVASSGRVTTCTVSGRFAGTPVGSCIARAVRAARLPPFTQARFEVHYQYRN